MKELEQKEVKEETKEEPKNGDNSLNEKEEFKEEVKEKPSLEKEVNDIKDTKFLASKIVQYEETISKLQNDIQTILGLLKANSNNFTDSKLSNSNDNEENKYYFDETKYNKYY